MEVSVAAGVTVEEVQTWASPQPIPWNWKRPWRRAKKAITLDALEARLRELGYNILERDEAGNRILVMQYTKPENLIDGCN